MTPARRRRQRRGWRCAVLFGLVVTGEARAQDDKDLARSIEQLRSTHGRWAVVTEFLNEDGTVARSATGMYEFEWVVEDRVLRGRSEIPELQQRSSILFYINERSRTIEMVSVGADGFLWIMKGPLGGETRHTQVFTAAGGVQRQLRFTRYNVASDAFQSRMEYSDDDGRTWTPGNHQQFRRSG